MSARKPAASRRDKAKAPSTSRATTRATAPAATAATAPAGRAPTQRAPSQHPTTQRPNPPRPASQRPTTQRADGWTPDRRATFLTALAEGHTVEAACAHVGLSVASAYALRHREGAEAFALGWRAACLLARDRLADILTSRAIDGQVDTYTRADGTAITRHRHDNRLAMGLLARLDRLAAQPADPAAIQSEPRSSPARRTHTRRGVTHRDSWGGDSWGATGTANGLHRGPAFPADPTGAAPQPAPPPEPQSPEAARIAAGAFPALLALVAEDADAGALRDFVGAQHARCVPQLPQLRRYRKGQEWLAHLPHCEPEIDLVTVWEDEEDGEMLTYFPPPADYDGTEYGRHGEPTYARTLTAAEMAEWDPVIEPAPRADGRGHAAA